MAAVSIEELANNDFALAVRRQYANVNCTNWIVPK